ncbi:putative PurR-regulated permease PerM [Thermocatellispora tengchongensis]|uniref:Putative PurR-regulated permease PerM n=1 Tax=Thermocatellispora tengchongensis TaxID=1073253 RepID=A0A840PH54_9ACTN|nr:AI-2E family transporter [Thermocatellispora tengchongensis]MBB5135365.1 putative PurR-regulated permease PerM [Thermocatellispora tengchongensis]
MLATMAAWSGCLILLGVVVYYFAQVLATLRFVMLPVAIALLLTALLFPLTRRLRATGMRPIWATWLTMLFAFAVLVGTGWIVGVRANDEFPRLVEQIEQTALDVQNWLITGPLHLQESQLASWVEEITRQLNEQRSAITGTVLTGATVAVEVLASIVLLLFVTFFLLKDGDRIWNWFLRAFGRAAPRVDRAGRAAWRTLSHYVQGTVAVAAVHGVIMGVVLAGMGVPLWAPLAMLIFLASFIPIVGIFFAGALATLVTLGARGPIYALVFIGILVVEQQLENHVLQPLIVGRALHFHPLAIILVLAVGGVLAGIAGAAIAVPVAAVLYRALPELRHEPAAIEPPPAPPGETRPPGPRDTPPPEPATEPATAEEPRVSDRPVAGEEPRASDRPVTGEERRASDRPVTGEEPRTSDRPVAGEERRASDRPVTGEEPRASDRPATAEERRASDRPTGA